MAGNYYTPIDLNQSVLLHHEVDINTEAYSLKERDYLRFDIKAGYTINYHHVNQIFSVVEENVFNRKNVLDRMYDDSSQSIRTEYQLGLFPYGAYRIEF